MSDGTYSHNKLMKHCLDRERHQDKQMSTTQGKEEKMVSWSWVQGCALSAVPAVSCQPPGKIKARQGILDSRAARSLEAR